MSLQSPNRSDSEGSNETARRDPSYFDDRSVSGDPSFTDVTGYSMASTCTLPESTTCLPRNACAADMEKEKDKDYPTFIIPSQDFRLLTTRCKRIPDMPQWLTDSGEEDDKVQRAFAYRWFRAQPQMRGECKCEKEKCKWSVQLGQRPDTLICSALFNAMIGEVFLIYQNKGDVKTAVEQFVLEHYGPQKMDKGNSVLSN